MLTRARFPFLFLVLAFLAGCDATSEEGTSTLIGRVVTVNSAPIQGATVNVVGTAETATTDATGTFSLLVEADSTGDSIPLQVFASGYTATTASATAVVDQEVSLPDIVLRSLNGDDDDDGGNDGDGGGDGPGGIDEGAEEPSGPAASITLVGRSSESIGVQSAGADETATLTFVVLDAFGNPVDEENAVDVNFSIANGPGGGEFIAPARKTTNSSGRVQTTISSGTVSGTVQLIATAMGESGEIRSLPVVITITGGFPDQAHFSVVAEQVNFPGYDIFGRTQGVTAFVGDQYGNPVQPGTAVYFTTDGGIIEGDGVTDALGRAGVTLVSAAPRASNEFSCPGGTDPNGYGIIEARTSDMNQQTVVSNSTVLFSGTTEIQFTDVDADPNNGDLGNYGFSVADRFGHPLAPGTIITVEADGVNVEAVGDDNIELGDHLCPGDGRTDFLISVVQGDETNEDDLPLPPQLETLTIRVSSPNGNAQLTVYNAGTTPEYVFERLDDI